MLHQLMSSWCPREQQYMSVFLHVCLKKQIFHSSGCDTHRIRAARGSACILLGIRHTDKQTWEPQLNNWTLSDIIRLDIIRKWHTFFYYFISLSWNGSAFFRDHNQSYCIFNSLQNVASVLSSYQICVPQSPGGVMRNIWPCEQLAAPSAPVIDSSAGHSHSWHPPAPGNARKSARSGRALPSTCHYREKYHQEQLSWGPLETQQEQHEVGDEEGWSTAVLAF